MATGALWFKRTRMEVTENNARIMIKMLHLPQFGTGNPKEYKRIRTLKSVYHPLKWGGT
jgi:hypothetical protein